jgi:hypothetical protein
MLTGKFRNSPGQLPPDQRRKTNSYVRAAGSFVPKIAAKAFEKFGFHSAEIMTDWARIIGADIAKYTEPERLKWPRTYSSSETLADGRDARPGGTLILRVDPSHALEVEYKATEIMDRINRYFGYRAIETLKIIQAPLKKNTTAALSPSATPATGAPPPPVDVSILDDGLKSALTRLWSSVQRDSHKK